MISLGKVIASLAASRRRWDEVMRDGTMNAPPFGDVATPLQERHNFGSNPGNLRMFAFLPQRRAAHPALVVVLHGCTQTAAGYDAGSGWSTLAERHGFVLLFPEQQRANNPNVCFNWFEPEDTRRDSGEALSIRQMIESLATEKGIDRSHIFITGLSAGGAMTSVMLACYPEVFAAGAIVAGLPYGAAGTVQQAFESMFQSPPRPAAEWGDLVRNASAHQGPGPRIWPRVSIWHGGADRTVVPANADELVKQWTAVHGLPLTPSAEDVVDGYPHQVWTDGSGTERVEFYSITGMAHGTPLATGTADGQSGAAGPFFLETGISSSDRIAEFFGLVDKKRRKAAAMNRDAANAQTIPDGEIPEKADARQERLRRPATASLDIGGTITKALKAAGLIKS